ncbi:unnamed protein product, partial [Diamesa serratosioi]
IPNGVFVNNLQLEKIYLYQNKIKFIGSTLFDELPKLYFVDLEKNICIDKEYSGSTAIIQLKNDIKSQCQNPNELQPTTTPISTEAPTTTTENPLELENDLIKELNINLEKENAELKEKLSESKSAQEKDQINRSELEAKNLELTERLSIYDAQKSTDMNPNEAPLTTTENPLEVKQIKINNLEQELLEQQKKNTIELAKVQQELSAAISDHQKEQDEVTRLERKNTDLSTKLSRALDDQQLQQEDMTKLNGTNSKLVQEIFKLNKEISTSNDLQKSQQTIMMESVSEVFSLNKQRRLDQLTIDNLKQELSDAKEELKKNSIEFESNQNELMNNFTLLNQKDRKESTELLTICESKNQELLKLNSFTMNSKIDHQNNQDEVTRLEQKNVDLSTKLSRALDDQQLQQEDMNKLNETITKLVQEVSKLNNKLEEEVNAAKIDRQENVKLSNALKTAQNVQENHQKQMNETNTKLQQENAKLIKDISTSNELQKSNQLVMMESMSELLSLNKQKRLDQLEIDNLKKELSDVNNQQQTDKTEHRKKELLEMDRVKSQLVEAEVQNEKLTQDQKTQQEQLVTLTRDVDYWQKKNQKDEDQCTVIKNVLIKANTKSDHHKEQDEVTRLERKNTDLSTKLSIALDDQQLQLEDMTKLNETSSKLVQDIFKLNNELSTSNELQKSQQMMMMESVSEVFSLNKQRRLDQLTIDNLKQELSDAKEELQKNSIEFESNQNELMNNFTLLNQKDREASTELLTICESKNKELLKLNSFTMNCDYADTDGAYTCVSNQLPINNRNMKLNTVI